MALALGNVCEPFVEPRPLCVMARGVLEQLCNAERSKALCARTAKGPYTRAVLFASVVALMSQVVLGGQPSVPAAYQAQADQLGVSDPAISDKLNQVELCVSAELVRDAARQAAPVLGALPAALAPLVPGYRTNILAGHHLAARAQRLEERRRMWAAPLPGQLLVGWEQPPRLATEVVWCEDGHAQARSWLGQGLPWGIHEDVWMADRHLWTAAFLGGMAARGGGLVMRPPGPLQGPLVGSRTYTGASDTGTGYAQRSALMHAPGAPLPLRRIPVAWHKPPRDGDAAIPLLRHVPRRHARAQTLATSYGKRWTRETMGQGWTATVTCEGHAWGSPHAAWFGLCWALLASNAVAVLQAAWRAVHGGAQVQQDSSRDSLALAIAQT